MKKVNLYVTLAVIASISFLSFISHQEEAERRQREKSITTITPSTIVKPIAEAMYTEIMLDNYTFSDWRDAIGFRESSDRWQIVNQYGYMGRYQIGKSVFKDLGFDIKNKQSEYLNDHILQNKAFLYSCKVNKYRLRKHIDKYVGKTLNGIMITESGLLAAAHLVGAGSVKKYLSSNGQRVAKDGNGVEMTHYLETFGGYNTSGIIPVRKIKLQ